MSNLYPPEGRLLHTLQNRANVETLSRLRQAMARETVVEGRVTLCTPAHDLVVQLGPFTGTIPREEAALGIREGTARENPSPAWSPRWRAPSCSPAGGPRNWPWKPFWPVPRVPCFPLQ